nr:unnamed protein product [Callosobruchus chinensis]
MDNYIGKFDVQDVETHISETINDFKQKTISDGMKFSIFHSNIRSISKNLDELLILLHDLEANFHCIVLTETFQIYNTEIYNIPGYDLIYNRGGINKNDGVIIYVKSDLQYSYEIHQIQDIGVVNMLIKYVDKTFNIIALYRSPSTSVDEFTHHLNIFLKQKANSDINVIVGDINIDILSDSVISNNYLNVMSENNYISMINDYTRVEGTSRSCIDHIFVKTKESLSKFSPILLKYKITDHYPTILHYLLPDKKTSISDSKLRYKTYINYDKLNDMLLTESWEKVYENKNLDCSVNCFIETLKNSIHKCSSKVKLKRWEIHRKRWITNGLVKSIKHKEDLHDKMIKSPDDKQLLNEFKRYRNALNNLIKKAKEQYYMTKIQENKGDSSNLWKHIKYATGKNLENKEITSLLLKSGEITYDKEEIAEEFADYFTNVGKELVANAKRKRVGGFQMKSRKVMSNSIALLRTTETEVERVIQQLKNKKSPGHDELYSETIKKVARGISKPLTYLFNLSLECGIFPESMKTAVVIPIFKKGDKLDPCNYRPISILSCLSKIFEKLLNERIWSFVEKHDLISEHQFGFKKGKSTDDAMLELMQEIFVAVDNKTPAMCVFVDLAKAFDTIDHGHLLDTLEDIGFRGKAHSLLESYLTGRSQTIKVNDTESKKRAMQCGVPQGSVLGPLLFTLYMNDIFSLQCSGKVVSFADDTAIVYTADTWEALKIEAEGDLKTVFNFLQSKLLTVNFTKTYYLPFTSYSSNLPEMKPLIISQIEKAVEISPKPDVKYLGVYIDCHLRWDVHIKNLVIKLRSLLGTFKLCRGFCNLTQLKILYNALVQSHMYYGIVIWGGAANCYLKKLEVVQKWILKTIYNKNITYPSDILYNESGVLDPKQLYCKSMLLKFYKDRTTIPVVSHKYKTRFRDSKNIEVPLMNKLVGQSCFLYLYPKVYNNVPARIKSIHSYSKFKYEIKKWIAAEGRTTISNILAIR